MIPVMKGWQQNIRMTVFPVIIIFFVHIATAYAQEGPSLQRPLTIHAVDERLDTLFSRLSRLTGFSFAYSPDRIDAAQRISLRATGVPAGRVLDTLAAQAAFSYRIKGKKILILPRGNKPSKSSSLHTLSGYVTDMHSRERLPYATVQLRGGGQYTVANSYGFYSLTLPPGTYTLTYSYVGYLPWAVTVVLRRDTTVTATLTPAEATLQEVRVTLADEEALAPARNGRLLVDPAAVQEQPAFLGEGDIVKSLEMMPGITFFGDGSTFFFVRGGNRDQNQILIDDAPVFNPSHMFGLFSSVTPEAVRTVRIYRGFFPADMGGRLSSVVDIRTREGDMSRFGAEGSLSPAAIRLTVQGPVVKEKSSFFVAARRSWFGWMPRAGDKSIERLRFYDLNGRFNTTLNERNRLYLSFYGGNDLFRQRSGGSPTASGITWGNMAGSLRWNHLFGQRLFLNTTLYGGSYDYDLVSSFEDDFSWHSHVAEFGVRSDLGWFRRPGDKIRTGIALSGHNFNPGNIYFRGHAAGGNFPLVPVKNAMGAALYLMREQKAGDHLTLNYGVRLTGWFNIGSTWEYRYNGEMQPQDSVWYGAGDIYHTSFAPEPRLSATYRLGSHHLSLAYSLTTQYMHLLTNAVTPFSSFEIWVPAGPNLKPQKAHQVQGGWHTPFGRRRYSIDAEVYYRRITGQTDYTDHAELLLNPALERDLRQGSARAWGAEMMVHKHAGRLTGWLSYTWSRVRLHTPTVNGGVSYPAAYDRPHEMTLSLNYRFSGHWQAGANMLAASGTPFSSPTAFFSYNGQPIPWYGSRNNDRLPPYFRLDISVTWRISRPSQRCHHDLTLGLFNATGRRNPFEINFNKIVLPDNTLVTPADFYVPPELVTTQMYLFRMIPSLTYHFKF